MAEKFLFMLSEFPLFFLLGVAKFDERSPDKFNTAKERVQASITEKQLTAY